MLAAYQNNGTCLSLMPDVSGDQLAKAVWIDLLCPSTDEEERVERLLKINIPTRDELREVESSSQLFREEGATFVTLRALSRMPGEAPRIASITLVVADGKFVTVRYADPTAFRNFVARVTKAGNKPVDSMAAFLCFAEVLVDRDADLLEEVGEKLDHISALVFAQDSEEMTGIVATDLNHVLKDIGRAGDMVARVQESLHSVGRAVPFLQLDENAREEQLRMKTLQRDAKSLLEHATQLSSQVQFLLDSSVGLISIQQNAIMKALSVATIFFMPPTLIAGIYGMNFQHMPELATHYGYPVALGLMVISAVTSYLYLHRRKML